MAPEAKALSNAATVQVGLPLPDLGDAQVGAAAELDGDTVMADAGSEEEVRSTHALCVLSAMAVAVLLGTAQFKAAFMQCAA